MIGMDQPVCLRGADARITGKCVAAHQLALLLSPATSDHSQLTIILRQSEEAERAVAAALVGEEMIER